jgi:hypothetical protein
MVWIIPIRKIREIAQWVPSDETNPSNGENVQEVEMWKG